MGTTMKPLAVVTGGSSGIGYELARQCERLLSFGPFSWERVIP